MCTVKRPTSTIKTSLWYPDIDSYRQPASDQIVTAKPYPYFDTMLFRRTPLALQRKNILFYSYIQIYIPLYLFANHDCTGDFYNSFNIFMQGELKDALLLGYHTRGRTLLTTKDFFWFGWFDVLKNNLAIFVLLNQPIEISDVTEVVCSWLSSYFAYTLRSTKEILINMLSTSHSYHWVNADLHALSEIQNSYWARRYFFLEIFKGNSNAFLDYFFYLQANMITKYCLLFSFFDAYARHSLEGFESVEQLFAFYQRAGITKKTFTNIPGMLEDYFFGSMADIYSYTKTHHHPYEYNIWLLRNENRGRSNTKEIELPLFIVWHYQKDFCLSVEERCMQRLLWDIHTLNYIGDYFHLCFNYRKMHSKRQVMELRAPDLDIPIELPKFEHNFEGFFNPPLESGEEDPAFDTSIPDHYYQIQEYRRQHEKEVNEMKNRNYQPHIDGTFEKYPDAFNGFREQMEVKAKKLRQEYKANRMRLPEVFIERCKRGDYYLPWQEWCEYHKETGKN